MTLDLVIRNGLVIDGSGLSSYHADLGISGNRIAQIGRINEKARRTVDADGHVVTPGFIDGHAHFDAQVFWDHLGTSACWQGVTTVIMGNCGFTLAPARAHERDLVLANLERAEDIPRSAMLAGIDWTWETYPEYLDAVDAVPKAINYGSYIGHSALRTWAMGERAYEQHATDDDLAAMKVALREAMHAGAMGFTTSRQKQHRTPDGRPVASRVASWREMCELVAVLGEVGAGVFEIALSKPPDEVAAKIDTELPPEWEGLGALAIETGVPITLGVPTPLNLALAKLRLIDATAAAGGRMFGQSNSLGIHHVNSFYTNMPFDRLPGWSEFRSLPIEEQKRRILDPSVRAGLVKAAASHDYDRSAIAGPESRPSDYGYVDIEVYNDPTRRNPSVAEIAQSENRDPVEVMLDLCIKTDFKQIFLQSGGRSVNGKVEDDDLLQVMKHPRAIMTFSDTGAHVSQIIACLQSYFLAQWVRNVEAFSLEEAVRMLTLVPALAWSIPDRGLLREGAIADINIFDPRTVGPVLPEVVNDLPSGQKRLVQRSDGFLATLVGGQVTLENCVPTGASPGRLLRGRLAATGQ